MICSNIWENRKIRNYFGMKVEEKLSCPCKCHGGVLWMVDVDPLVLKFDARCVFSFTFWPLYRRRRSLSDSLNKILDDPQNSLPVLSKCGTQFWSSHSATDRRTGATPLNTPVFFVSRTLANKGLALCTFRSTSIDSTIFCISCVILFKSSYLAWRGFLNYEWYWHLAQHRPTKTLCQGTLLKLATLL